MRAGVLGASGLAVVYYWPEVYFAGQACTRVGRAVIAVSLIAADYKWHWDWRPFLAGKLLRRPVPPVDADSKSALHRRAAEWLLWLFQHNGGIYIKVGQHLAALDFVLPPEYTSTLSRLFRRAPQSTPGEVEAVVREELGGVGLHDVFSDFVWPPIGAASLAQVHRARLRADGRLVAVKVQHRRLAGFADVDIITAAALVRLVRWAFPRFEFAWLADELRLNLPRELNFELEAHNAERTARNFRQSGLLLVPEVHWGLSRRRLLVMEYCEGVCIDDTAGLLAEGLDLRRISDRLTKAYSEMIFLHGFVHCDPHPGNILVRRRPGPAAGFDIILLDHGLYRELSDDFRLAYAALWKALVEGNEPAIAAACRGLGGGSAYRLFSSILAQRAWDRISLRSLDQPRTLAEIEAIREKFPVYFERVAELLARVPRPLLLLLKTNDLLRSIDRNLAPPSATCRSFLIMARYCAFALFERDWLAGGLVQRLRALLGYMVDIVKFRLAELVI